MVGPGGRPSVFYCLENFHSWCSRKPRDRVPGNPVLAAGVGWVTHILAAHPPKIAEDGAPRTPFVGSLGEKAKSKPGAPGRSGCPGFPFRISIPDFPVFRVIGLTGAIAAQRPSIANSRISTVEGDRCPFQICEMK
jgi:hypothetical protein